MLSAIKLYHAPLAHFICSSHGLFTRHVAFILASTYALVYVQNFFGAGGGGGKPWPFGAGVTVMEKWEILVGWVTKVCLKCTERAGVGREDDI